MQRQQQPAALDSAAAASTSASRPAAGNPDNVYKNSGGGRGYCCCFFCCGFSCGQYERASREQQQRQQQSRSCRPTAASCCPNPATRCCSSIVVFVAMMCSGISVTYLHPFLPDMIKSFGYSNKEAGTYIGMVLSSFHMGRMLGCYAWTPLLTRFGVNAILCTSLPLLALTSLLFGSTGGFLTAAFAGLASGLFNALTPAVRRCLADSAANDNNTDNHNFITSDFDIADTTDSEELDYIVSGGGGASNDDNNGSRLATLVCLGWCLGCLIGPLIGGCLASLLPPAFMSELSTTANNNGFSLILPPLLPACIGVALIFCAAVGITAAAAAASAVPVRMYESRPASRSRRHQRRRQNRRRNRSQIRQANEDINNPAQPSGNRNPAGIALPLILVTSESQNGTLHVRQASLSISSNDGQGAGSNEAGRDVVRNDSHRQSGANNAAADDSHSLELSIFGDGRGNGGGSFILVAGTFAASDSDRLWSMLLGAVAHISSELGFHSFGGGLLGSLSVTRGRLLALLATFLLSFAIAYQRVLLLAWCATDRELGGLSFGPGQLTGLLCISAASQLFVTAFGACLSKPMREMLYRRFNCDRIYIYSLFLMLLSSTLMVLTPYSLQIFSSSTLWITLVGLECVQSVSHLASCCSLNALVTHSLTPSQLGPMSAAGMACSSLARLFAPMAAGSLLATQWTSSLVSSSTPELADLGLPFLLLGLVIILCCVAGLPLCSAVQSCQQINNNQNDADADVDQPGPPPSGTV